MSTFAISDEMKNAVLSKKLCLIVGNFADPDNVKDTGNILAGQKAAETLNGCLKELFLAVGSVDGNALIVVDHGNLETMVDVPIGVPFTQYPTNAVEMI
jgi:2,3-bisphosphoglycerate-independent phosphoglycerate mutase